MHRRSRPLAFAATLLTTGALAAAIALRSCSSDPARATAPGRSAAAAHPDPPGSSSAPALGFPSPAPTTGWHDPAETVAIDLRRFLLGRPAAGAFEEARAEAARADLALFPPDAAELRPMLLSPDGRLRTLALAALAARGEASDDLLRIVLRSQRPEDDGVVRLLGAELVAALPADLLARHEEDLLRAFAREPNPLVLAVALPALERMEEPRLRALLDAQLAHSAPEMLPVLVGLARDRLGPLALEDAGVLVRTAE